MTLQRCIQAGKLYLANVSVCQTKLGQDTPGQQKASGVCGSVVGQADRESVVGQLMAVGRCNNNVPSNSGIGDLADDVLVCETHHEAVLGGIVPVVTKMSRLSI